MELTGQRYYTPEEYLKLEAAAEFKSEYIDGQIIPMAGESTNHNLIAGNFYAALNFGLRQQNYTVFIGDVRLWIPKRRIYTYPDIAIVAGEPEYLKQRTDTITNPQVIIEVLPSPIPGGKFYAKKLREREEKFEAYRTLETFEEYLLVEQSRIHVDQFSKTAKKRWLFCEYDEEDDAIALSTVPFQISLLNLYNKVNFNRGESKSDRANSLVNPLASPIANERQEDGLIAVYRWWHPINKDWLTLADGEVSEEQIKNWGYTDKIFQFYALKYKPENGIAVYRWWHPIDQDWLTLADEEISETQLKAWGYTDKTFQFYAFKSPLKNGIAIYRWWHPIDKNWLTLAKGQISDAQLRALGYTNKTFQFYTLAQQ